MTSRVTAATAVALIESGDRVFIHGGSAFPQALIDALADRAGDLHDVELIHLHINGDPSRLLASPSFRHRTFFVDGTTRDAVAAGRATYIPAFLSDIPHLFESGPLQLDVALLHLSPPDENGDCSLGVSVDCALAAARTARVRIAQINPQMPRTRGETSINLRDLDAVVDVDSPLPEARSVPPSPGQVQIGDYVAELVDDGATLQLGIGAIPNAVLQALTSHKDLGIHSEVISDGILDLVERGVITGARKPIDRGLVVAAFLNGSRDLYRFANANDGLAMRPTSYTNDPHVIRQLDGMVAINSAIEVDLTGQVCAESIGHRIYSGVGGQVDFMRGSALAARGKPIIAMSSTARGGSVSRVVTSLLPGAGVTTSRAHVHHVVTEFGSVDLHGLDLEERAIALIGIAHPSFRDGLTEDARTLGLVRRGAL